MCVGGIGMQISLLSCHGAIKEPSLWTTRISLLLEHVLNLAMYFVVKTRNWSEYSGL
jgi:hypothetical protein